MIPRSHAGAAASLLALAAALVPPGSWAADPAGEVIDRVVAVVRIRSGLNSRIGSGQKELAADVITLSALEFEARVLYVEAGGIEAATAALDEEALRGALDNAINERLLEGEAELLAAWRVEPEDVEAALRSFREKFASEREFRSFLARNDADVQTLNRVLERRLRARKVIDSKVRLRAQVSEADVRRYYDAHRAELRGDYEEVRRPLRERLVRERFQKLTEAEIAQLRRTHEVRRVAPFAKTTGRDRG